MGKEICLLLPRKSGLGTLLGTDPDRLLFFDLELGEVVDGPHVICTPIALSAQAL